MSKCRPTSGQMAFPMEEALPKEVHILADINTLAQPILSTILSELSGTGLAGLLQEIVPAPTLR